MGKNIFILFAIFILPFLTACSSSKGIDISKLEKSSYELLEQSTDVEMSAKESNIMGDTEKITLILINRSDKAKRFYGLCPRTFLAIRESAIPVRDNPQEDTEIPFFQEFPFF